MHTTVRFTDRQKSAGRGIVVSCRLVLLAVLLLALPGVMHAQGHGPQIRGMQQGSRGPRSGPPQQQGEQGVGGNSMFPVTPSTASAAHAGLRMGPTGRWWDDKGLAQTVGLSREQKSRMDGIFNANKPAILSAYQVLMREQAKMTESSKQPQTDKSQLFAQIDAVNQARTSLEKATAQMLLEIRAQLDTTQIAKLESLQ